MKHQKDDIDKAIIHLTEAVLLPFQPSQHVVHVLFQLATVLQIRFNEYKQPEDVKSSLKYCRFLRINFHTFEAFDIPLGEFTSVSVNALSGSLTSESGDMIQDMEEMVALFHKQLAPDISTNDLNRAMTAIRGFTNNVILKFRVGGAKLPPEKIIQVLRETEKIQREWEASYALAHCLSVRFEMAQAINDYEEAMAIVDKIVATHSSGDILTMAQKNAIQLIKVLVSTRLNSYPSPEYLEEAIHRFRTLFSLPSLPDRDRTYLTESLDYFEKKRISYFGANGNSDFIMLHYPSQNVGPEDQPLESQMSEKLDELGNILATMQNDEITSSEASVEEAVKLSRTLLPFRWPDSGDRLSCQLAIFFAEILNRAYACTHKLEFLNEAITAYRDIRKMSAPKLIHFLAGERFIQCLIARFTRFRVERDLEELMQLYPEVAKDGSKEAFDRFKISHWWASTARARAHPSTSTAYETAMSLMQETLVFSPTLQIQHYRLTHALRGYEGLPSDYASYQIEQGRTKQAIETLERGRALLWSEMRGLRTSADHLHALNPDQADKLVDINRRLESVTMSIAQSESEELGDSETRTGRREEMDLIGCAVGTQRRLLEERNNLISHIRSLPGFENFLKPPSFNILNSAAAHGPVIVINQSQFTSNIIILLKDSPPTVISTPSDFHDRAHQLKDDLLRVRKEKGLDSKDYHLTLASILTDLYELVGKPVVQRLRQLKVREKSRVWWCPTSAFCSLPLHAMGPIPSDDRDKVYFMDLYIPSYTPTLSALIESRKPGSQPKPLDKPSLLLVAQPETLPGAWDEIKVLEAVGAPVSTLISQKATATAVVASLRDNQFVHLVCHGLLEAGKPFDASFELHGDNLTLLEIVRSQLPAAEFAFLSACHTAELTEDSIADEGLHLTAAMQFCGFRSVVGTMWAMADTDGADLSKHFYKSLFPESSGPKRSQYYERSARALQVAVKKLRKKRGVTLERWVNFVHYGA